MREDQSPGSIDFAAWSARFREAQAQLEPECGDCGVGASEIQYCRDRFCPHRKAA